MKRYGPVLALREKKLDEYLWLYSDVSPAVEAKMLECNIRALYD